MNRLEATLSEMTVRLSRLGADSALVGGLAVSARAEPRFTRDVDLAVSVADDAAAEAVIKNLVGQGYVAVALLEQEAVGRLATVRLVPPGQTEEGVVVDLLFASSGIEREIVEGADTIELLPGVVVSVATSAHLIALKILASDESRPQDEADLRSLLSGASDVEIEEAATALELVAERGFDRGRDLESALRAAVSRWRG